MNKVNNESPTDLAVKFLSNIMLEKRVHESTMHKTYLCPADDGGRIGPMTSILSFLNGICSIITGAIGTLSVVKILDLN